MTIHSPTAQADDDPLAGLAPELGRILRHDIKTPLQAASLNLELLAMERESDPELLAALETIQQSLDSAIAMLQKVEAG